MIFFINLKKDIGKKKFIENIVINLGGTYWDGVDVREFNEKGNVISYPDKKNATRAAKQAKINLLNHINNLNSNDNYFVLFEDDIIIHENFYEYFKISLEFMKNNNHCKLLYFGVSSNIDLKSDKDFDIVKLPKNKKYAGAYGVIINNSIIPQLLYRSDDLSLFYKPFDIYSLGYIQECYDCFICIPQIVIPIVTVSNIRENRPQELIWNNTKCNPSKYIYPHCHNMYVITDTDSDTDTDTDTENIQKFNKLVSSLMPYINVIYEKTKTKTKNDTSWYIETTINIHWNDLSYDFFNYIENNKYIIKFFINNAKSEKDIFIVYNGTEIIHSKKFDFYSL